MSEVNTVNYINELHQEIEAAAVHFCQSNQVSPIVFSGYQEYLVTGDRKKFENGYMKRRKQLAVLGISCIHDCNKKKLEFLEQIIWEICNEYSWAVPAHLPITDNRFDETAPFCIDLFAAETANALGEINHHLANQLSPMLRRRISREIKTRIFQPFLNKEWFWETSQNNWTAVIAGSIGMAAIQECFYDSDYQKKILEKVDKCLKIYLESFPNDGTCVEGIGYWSYGFGYYIYYAEMYREKFHLDIYLNQPKVKEIAEFPARVEFSEGNFVPFSDYTSTQPPTGLLSFCANYFDIKVPSFSKVNTLDGDHCYRFAHLLRNIYWTKKIAIKENHNNIDSHYFNDSQWLVKKEKNIVFAAKGGNNQESHNHNDVGHFVYGLANNLFFTDLGAGLYTRNYFQENYRYQFLTNASRGHSLPIINGNYQMAGNYKAQGVGWDGMNFNLSLEELYPETIDLIKCERSFDTSKIHGKLLITDEFQFKTSNNKVIENYVTLIQPEKRMSGVLLKIDDHTCELTLNTNEIQIVTETFLDHDGKTCNAYLIQGTYHGDKRIVTKADIRIYKQ